MCGFNKIAHDRVSLIGIDVPNGCSLIPLTKGYYTIIDEDDYERASKFNWNVVTAKHTQYARSQINSKNTSLHRFLMNVTDNTVLIDHINRNGLDNRKINLRRCTIVQNAQNQKANGENKSSSFKGVSSSKNNKWKVSICVNGTRKHLGTFDNEIQAAKRYDIEAKLSFGEFAYLNFP